MAETKVKIQNRISAVIHRPDGESKGLTILCPGYLDSKDYDHMKGLGVDLASAGYTAVSFDPTGIWESGGNISQYTIPQQLRDIKDIITYMHSDAKYNRVILGGHSLGGFISILYASQDPTITTVFAIMSPYALTRSTTVEKISKWKSSGMRISLRDIPGTDKKREFRVPFSNFKDAANYNLLNEVQKLKIPILLIAGEDDDVVQPKNVEMLYKKANQPKKLAIMKKINHDYRHHPEEIKLINKEIIYFLNSYTAQPQKHNMLQ